LPDYKISSAAERRNAYLQLHFSVFLWGFTAILGKLIELREGPLVWYRILITCMSLLLLPRVWKRLKQLKRKDIKALVGIGCLVCTHWLCFYGSIKFSNVSVALSCLSTTSFITSFIEPLFFRTKIKRYELFLGLLIVPGIYMIFHFTKFYAEGIVLGLLAAGLAAVFTTLNKKMVSRVDTTSITFVELSGGFVFLSIILPFYLSYFPEASMVPTSNDWVYLLILAVGCTTLPYILSLNALKHLSAFASTLSVNLEPIYGIIMAIFFFQENKELNPGFYIGTLIILLAVFLHPLLHKRFEKVKGL
jgi:drug/metabolite transporter (DMT)-like permease